MDIPNEPTTICENTSQDTLEEFDKSPGPAVVSSVSLDGSMSQASPSKLQNEFKIPDPTSILTQRQAQDFEQDSLEVGNVSPQSRHDQHSQDQLIAMEQERVDLTDRREKPAEEEIERLVEPQEESTVGYDEEQSTLGEQALQTGKSEQPQELSESQEELGDENKENITHVENDFGIKSQDTFDIEEENNQKRLGNDNLIGIQSFANEILNQTFESATNLSHYHQQFKPEPDTMEFTKNYSDDLLMGSNEQRASSGANTESGGHDLADFELPPYNGSSSGSEQAATKNSPVKQRKSSTSTATQAPSSSHTTGGLVATDLTAVKSIIISSYSKLSYIFHWKKPIESGIVFAIGMTLIIALTFFSIISVIAYGALIVILTSGLMRIYKISMKALSRPTETPVDHIWEKVLDLDVSMSPSKMHELVETSHANLNASLVYFKQVLLFEDKVATLKFSLFLYSLTYIGAWFNGLTLITILYISLFSAPVVYEKNKTKIDEYITLATNQVSSMLSTIKGRFTAVALGSLSNASSKKQS